MQLCFDVDDYAPDVINFTLNYDSGMAAMIS